MTSKGKIDYTEALFRKLVSQIANNSKLLPKDGPLEISLLGEAVTEEHVLNGVTINLTVHVIDEPQMGGTAPAEGMGDTPLLAPAKLLRCVRRIPRTTGTTGQYMAMGDSEDALVKCDPGEPLTIAGYVWCDLMKKEVSVKSKRRSVSTPRPTWTGALPFSQPIPSKRQPVANQQQVNVALETNPGVLPHRSPVPRRHSPAERHRSPGAHQQRELPEHRPQFYISARELNSLTNQHGEVAMRQNIEVRKRSPAAREQREARVQNLETHPVFPDAERREMRRRQSPAIHKRQQNVAQGSHPEVSRQRSPVARQSPAVLPTLHGAEKLRNVVYRTQRE